MSKHYVQALTYKKMYDYQDSMVLRMIRSLKKRDHQFIIANPGAGKTTMVHGVATHVIKNKIDKRRKVLITAPQVQICNGFLRNARDWEMCGSLVEFIPIQEFVYGPNLKHWLAGNNEGITICCNASIANHKSGSFNPFADLKSCSDILWVIDEAHHSEAPKFGSVLKDFLAKDGRVIYVTATPFNTNGILSSLSIGSSVNVVLRTLGEHMLEGYCPKLSLEHIVMHDDKTTTQTSLQGATYTANVAKTWANYISTKYAADNKPKTLIIIPPTRGGKINKTTRDTAKELQAHLQELIPGVRILDVVGSESSSNNITEAISKESTGETDHDIIISCKRFDEGTDVPSIAAVYHIGMCSDRLAIQRMGRALRNKKKLRGYADKYPEYVDMARMVFFIFASGSDKKFAEQAIRVIAAVECYSSYKLFAGASLIKSKLKAKIEQAQNSNVATDSDVDATDSDHDDIDDFDDCYGKDTEDALEAIDKLELSIFKTVMENAGTLSSGTFNNLQDISTVNKDLAEALALSKLTEEQAQDFADKVLNAENKHEAVRESLLSLVEWYAESEVTTVHTDIMAHYVTVLTGKQIQDWGVIIQNHTNSKNTVYDEVVEICKFTEENFGEPTPYTFDPVESRLGLALARMRHTTISLNWYEKALRDWESRTPKYKERNPKPVLGNIDKKYEHVDALFNSHGFTALLLNYPDLESALDGIRGGLFQILGADSFMHIPRHAVLIAYIRILSTIYHIHGTKLPEEGFNGIPNLTLWIWRNIVIGMRGDYPGVRRARDWECMGTYMYENLIEKLGSDSMFTYAEGDSTANSRRTSRACDYIKVIATIIGGRRSLKDYDESYWDDVAWFVDNTHKLNKHVLECRRVLPHDIGAAVEFVRSHLLKERQAA